MAQCPEMHLFCITCMTSHASTLLSAHNPRIPCLDCSGSGCSSVIPETELRCVLPEKTMRLWERLSQCTEIINARLVGLEECPFCDYGVMIENNDEKILRCGNEEVCSIVSYRTCKKPASNFIPTFSFFG